MQATKLESVFMQDGDRVIPTELARGPWSPNAQHGGAPAGLLAAIAEDAMARNGDWKLTRITLEFLRPVPLAALTPSTEVKAGGSVSRVEVALLHEGAAVVRGVALFIRARPLDLPAMKTPALLPLPEDCGEPVRIPGMADQRSFHYSAMESRLASGSVAAPGPAAAWLRLAVPLIKGRETPPAAQAIAAADFGNGISWAVPLERFVFANADLTVYLHRHPVGEWVGVQSNTTVGNDGTGLTMTKLYDVEGMMGVAQQALLIKAR